MISSIGTQENRRITQLNLNMIMMKKDLLLLVSRRSCSVLFSFYCFFFFYCFRVFHLFLFCFEGVNLLLKNKKLSQPNLIRLPAHLISSPPCTCSRSFHLFCTDLFPSDEQNIDMLYIHPAPRIYERDYSRRIPTQFRKSDQKFAEDNDLDTIVTTRSEPLPSLLTSTESQFNEKKVLFLFFMKI